MIDEKTQRPIDDSRRFIRLPFQATVQYRYGGDEGGEGFGQDVGRGGIAVELGRYLRPGTLAMIAISDGDITGSQTELKARVVWCAPSAGASDFRAGFQIIHDEPAVIAEISQIVHRALFASGRMLNRCEATPEQTANCWLAKPAHQTRPTAVGM